MNEKLLVTIPAIANIHVVTNKTAWRWTKYTSFPAPAIDVFRDQKWVRGDVDKWVEENCERTHTFGGLRYVGSDKVSAGTLD